MDEKLIEMYSNLGQVELTIITLKEQLKYYTDLKKQLITPLRNAQDDKDLHTENRNSGVVEKSSE